MRVSHLTGGRSGQSEATAQRCSWPACLELIPFLPWLLVVVKYRHLGDSIVRQHDNLDWFQALVTRLSWADLLAAPGTTLPYVLGGIPRDVLGSELYLANIIGVSLPMMWSLFVAEFVIRSLAFYGMTVLARTAGIGDYKVIVYGTATVFALLPFYTPSFGAVAAVPFLLAAFLRVLQDGRLSRWPVAVFVLFPLSASAFITIPYLAFLVLVVIALLPIRRINVIPAALGVGILGLSVLVVDWRIFYASLFGPTTQRVEQIGSARAVDWSMLVRLRDSMSEEYAHAWLGKSWLMGLVFVATLALLACGWRKIGKRRRFLMSGLVAAVIVAAVIAQLWQPFEARVLAAVFHDWGRFQMERVRWADPTIIYLLLALALTVLVDLVDWGRSRRWLAPAVIVVVLATQGLIVVSEQRFVKAPDSLTVREFYAPETMSEIREAVDAAGGELVVSVGLHPAVAIANGIDSADGYSPVYPLEYKYRFRQLIAPALDVMPPGDRAYFDRWGSRAYVFQPDLPLRASYSGPSECGERDLVVDPAAYERLNITHVVSSCQLTNAEAVGLELVLETGSDDELGPVWLYEVR